MRRRGSLPVRVWSAAGFLPAALLIAQPPLALGCAACFGQSDSPLAAGMNWAILSLLGFIVAVLGGVAVFFVFLTRRAGRAEASAQAAEQQTLPGFEERFYPRWSRASAPDLRNPCRHGPALGVIPLAAARRPHDRLIGSEF